MYTYFVHDGEHVKIGRAKNVSARMSNLQGASSKYLKVLLALPGDHEQTLHRLFKRHRIRGEWFRFDNEIRQFISAASGKRWQIPFYTWLSSQIDRDDMIGRFAVRACSDPKFPTTVRRLSRLLQHYRKGTRPYEAAKAAHKEWREGRGMKRRAILTDPMGVQHVGE